jgi:hypothetical protein
MVYDEHFLLHLKNGALSKECYWWLSRSRPAPEEGGGFADYAVVSFHCLRLAVAITNEER